MSAPGMEEVLQGNGDIKEISKFTKKIKDSS
jgi:hypothetical protein